MTSYNQPQKQEVRSRLLSAAVNALAEERSTTPIVQIDELHEIIEYSKSALETPLVPQGFADSLGEEVYRWESFYSSRVGVKEAGELKVLYLCGPEPLNDLLILMSLGIDPHNVWAVTSSESDLEAAVADISTAGLALKIHHGDLATFFDAFPESFDIIYIDACGPFVGGSPNTLLPIRSVFSQHRLNHLAVLITTFSEPPQNGNANTAYVDVVTAYFRYRFRDLPRPAHAAEIEPEVEQYDPVQLKKYISDNLNEMYSEFITKLITELSGVWIPSCRALSSQALFKSYLAPKKQAKKAVAAAEESGCGSSSMDEFIQKVGQRVISPSSYPLWSFWEALKLLDNDFGIGNHLGNLKINGQESGVLIGFASLLDGVVEGHWDCLSEKMKKAVALSWFDAVDHFSCDKPLPNLLINSLMGIYGRPWFVNPRESIRLSYQSKKNTMFSDLLVFDQCRYFYDWWPTIDLCPNRFSSLEFQVLARCIIDRIGWHNWHTDTHPFRGSAVAGLGETSCSKQFDFAEREHIED